MTDNGALSRKQQRFIRALVTSKNIREAAGTARISERTAWRWLRLDSVQQAAGELQDAMLAEATRHAAGLLSEALDVLATIMRDGMNSATARVSAARTILESGLKYSELVTLAGRVAILESRIGGAE